MGKYTSQFKSLKNKLYTVDLEGENIKGTKDFILGGTPFVTSMDSEDETIYSPIKGQCATVTMVTKEYPFELYSSTLQGRKCTLYSGTDSNPRQKVEWVGYVTPCMFNMGFTYIEQLEIECIDGISVLKDIPYQSKYTAKQKLSFSEIVINILKLANCYKYLYVSDNVQLTKNGTDAILDKLYISEQNFFDEKDDMNTLDQDLAWNCYNVLLEICKYLGYSIVAKGDEVFMIDYDAIKHNINTYHKYSLTDSSATTRVTLNHSYNIEGNTFAETGANVSLDEVYNKVSVKDEFYSFEDMFPEFGNDLFEKNITRCLPTDENFTTGKDLVMNYFYENNGYYKNFPFDNFNRYSKNGNDISFQIFICKGWRNRMWVCIVQIKESTVVKNYKYGAGNADRTTYYADKRLSWGDVMNVKGSTLCRFWKREISSSDYNKWRANYHSNWWAQSEETRYNAWKVLLDQEPQNISLSPYIILKNDSGSHISRNNVYSYPFLKFSTDGNGASFGGEGAYLIIQGSVLYHDEQNTPFPLSDGADNGKLKRDVDCKRGEEMYLPCRLKWGDRYWTGDGWSSNVSNFPLRFGIPNQGRHYNRDHYSNKQIFDKFVEFNDTAQSVYNCNEKGVYIPSPNDGNLDGGVEFTIYANRDMYGDSYHGHWDGYDRYCSYVYVLKGFQIKAVIDNGILDDLENESDTIYTNVIPNGAVNDMDEITFKICTYDYKSANYSSVFYMDSNKQSQYLKTTFNKALNSLENGTNSTETDMEGLKQEEHLIFKMVTQYQNAKKIFDVTLKDNDYKPYTKFTNKVLDGTFIIQEMGYNYRYDSVSLKLIEKA